MGRREKENRGHEQEKHMSVLDFCLFVYLFFSLAFSLSTDLTVLLVVTYSGMGWTPRCCCWQASRDDHCRAGHTSHSDGLLCSVYIDTYQTPGRHIWGCSVTSPTLADVTDACCLQTAIK